MPNNSIFDNLSDDEIAIIENEIAKRRFKGFSDLEEWCKAHGWEISRSALWTRAQKIQKYQLKLRSATDAALLIEKQVKDEGGSLHDATLSVIQAGLFDAVTSLEEANEEEDPTKRIELLGKAARASADVGRASVSVKKWQQEIAAKARAEALEEAAQRVDKAAKAQGLDAQQAAFWRNQVLQGGV